MNDLPKRKPIRILAYDYSSTGAYFITVCVHDRKPILWNVGAATCRPYGVDGDWTYEKVGFYADRSFYLAEIVLRSCDTYSTELR